jgi:hypothetical protein
VGDTAIVIHRVRFTVAGPATSTLTVQGGEPDPNSGNNRQTTSVSVLQQQPPPPPPPPGPPVDPTDPDDGVPNPNQTVVVQEVAGRVLVKLPGEDRYVDLASLTLEEIPNGTLVDARKGRFRPKVAAAGGTTAETDFYEGISEINQLAAGALSIAGTAPQPGVTELRLAGGDFGRPCTTPLAKAKAKQKPKRKTFGLAQAKPVKPVRRLWGSGSGNFRTRGRYSSATVRGTIWLTEDYCNGTLVRVRQGIVAVRDLVKKRSVLVQAGKSYFAEAPAPNSAKKGGAQRGR